MTPLCIVHTSLPSEAAARELALALVQAGLAACAQVQALHSVYRWQGEVEQSDEWGLTLKTTAACWPALQAFVRAHHPYDVPELVMWPMAASADYGDWVQASCTASAPPQSDGAEGA